MAVGPKEWMRTWTRVRSGTGTGVEVGLGLLSSLRDPGEHPVKPGHYSDYELACRLPASPSEELLKAPSPV